MSEFSPFSVDRPLGASDREPRLAKKSMVQVRELKQNIQTVFRASLYIILARSLV